MTDLNDRSVSVARQLQRRSEKLARRRADASNLEQKIAKAGALCRCLYRRQHSTLLKKIRLTVAKQEQDEATLFGLTRALECIRSAQSRTTPPYPCSPDLRASSAENNEAAFRNIIGETAGLLMAKEQALVRSLAALTTPEGEVRRGRQEKHRQRCKELSGVREALRVVLKGAQLRR